MSRMMTPDVSEEQFVLAISKVSDQLNKRFHIPGWDADDLHQFCALESIEALPRFDPAKKPLVNFLYAHCRFRVNNAFRNLCMRSEKPCKTCGESDESSCRADGAKCKIHKDFTIRNNRKRDLAQASSCDVTVNENFGRPFDSAEEVCETKDLLGLVDRFLDVGLRMDYLKMKEGVAVPLCQRQKINEAVLDIFKRHGVEPEDFNWTPEKPMYGGRGVHDMVASQQEKGVDVPAFGVRGAQNQSVAASGA